MIDREQGVLDTSKVHAVRSRGFARAEVEDGPRRARGPKGRFLRRVAGQNVGQPDEPGPNGDECDQHCDK